jgi:hypothetical protein
MPRIRSPNYPQLSLPEAINRAKLIHAAERHLAAPKEVIAKHLGYNGLNGASLVAISALGKYGLIEEVNGDKVKVSPLALSILYPKFPQEKNEAIEEAALKPVLFAEIHKEWEGHRPSEENLRSYLIRRNFATEALDRVIKSYRETIDLVTQESVEYDPANVGSPGQKQGEDTMREQFPTAVPLVGGEGVGVHPTVKADSGDFRVSFTDGGGAIEVSGRLKSAKSVERLIKALEAGKTLFEMIGPDNKE